jgi:hypothetical protein
VSADGPIQAVEFSKVYGESNRDYDVMDGTENCPSIAAVHVVAYFPQTETEKEHRRGRDENLVGSDESHASIQSQQKPSPQGKRRRMTSICSRTIAAGSRRMYDCGEV